MPHAVTLIRSRSLSDVAEYAYAATAPAEARLIFLAGACPLNAEGSTAAPGDYAGQAAQAFANMSVALTDAGAGVRDVISTRVLVATARRKDLVTAWQVTAVGLRRMGLQLAGTGSLSRLAIAGDLLMAMHNRRPR